MLSATTTSGEGACVNGLKPGLLPDVKLSTTLLTDGAGAVKLVAFLNEVICRVQVPASWAAVRPSPSRMDRVFEPWGRKWPT